MSTLTLSQACEGCLLYKTATGRSESTVSGYRICYKKLQLFFEHIDQRDPQFHTITKADLVHFFAWLQNEYISEPDGVAPRGKIKLSPKSIFNIHTAISSLWTWGTKEGYVASNIVRAIDPPQFEPPVIEPFAKEDIAALLKACDRSRTWKTRQNTANSRPTADRDRAIILLLLDTGIRRAELCDIQIDDLNLTANTIKVRGKGKGRDQKERMVYFGRRTARAIWRYHTPLIGIDSPDGRLFLVGLPDDPRKMHVDVLGRLLKRIGQRAGVANVHPHRFRHTFAITYLRNGGDPFTLQILLGHSSLDMVKRYLNIVRADCADAHQRASPVDNWKL